MSKAEDILEKFKKSFNTPSTKDERIKVVLMCIVISTTFWFFNALNKSNYITRVNYPISIEYNQNDFVATAPLPNRIPIEVSGGGWDLMTRYFGFKMRPLEINVENPSQTNHVMTSSLRGEIVPMLEPITINYFLQDSIGFKIEKKVKASVLLQYDTTQIEMESNYLRTSQVQIQPSTIELIGPESVLKAMGDTLWINTPITGVGQDFQDNLDVPELPELVEASLSSVEVSFTVVRLISMSKNISIEKVNFPNTEWQIEPNAVRVSYMVPETSLDVTDTTAIKVWADFKKMASDSSIIIQNKINNTSFRSLQFSVEEVKATKND